MKKILVLGTNENQADMMLLLCDLGWEVHSCGYKKEGKGSMVAHKFHLVDTADIKAVEQLAKKLKVEYIYSVASDTNIRTATIASENLGLPVMLDSSLIDLFHHKDYLRIFLNRHNIGFVEFSKIESPEDTVNWNVFPCVVKPTDSQGQRGVQLIKDKSQLMEAITASLASSKSKTALVEEFLEGTEVSTNIIIQDGKVLLNEFTERLVFDDKSFGLPRGHSIPVRSVIESEIRKARKMVERMIFELGILDAVLYIQLKMTPKGPKIIEVAPRLDGCHIWRLLKLSRGYDIQELTIKLLTKEKINEDFDLLPKKKLTLKFHHLPTGTIFSENRLNLPESCIYNDYRYKEGETIQPINGRLEVVGYYIQNS